MVTSLKGPMQALLLNAPNPASGQHRPMPPLETAGHSWASLVSLLLKFTFYILKGLVCFGNLCKQPGYCLTVVELKNAGDVHLLDVTGERLRREAGLLLPVVH